MENSERKSDIMKPILLKAGIPLALSLVGFICSMITTRRKFHGKRSPSENKVEFDSQGLNSLSEEVHENTQITDSLISLRIREAEILGLKYQVSDLIYKERELEARFYRYCELKEEEIVLMELRNMLVLEIIRSEFLEMRVESMEAEKHRFEVLVGEYMRVMEELKSAKLENGVLKKKVKKHLRKNIETSRVVHRQNLVLKEKQSAISECHEELEGKNQVVKELENEMFEVKKIVDELQEENKGLIERLELVESSASPGPNNEGEEKSMDKQDELLAELEQLRKAQAADHEELVYLRWVNACLRHELMRNQDQHTHEHRKVNGEGQEVHDEKGSPIVEYESDGSSTIMEHGESCTGGHKRVKFLRKLRKWVGKNDEHRRSWDEKEHKQKYPGVQSISGARKSCSSV